MIFQVKSNKENGKRKKTDRIFHCAFCFLLLSFYLPACDINDKRILPSSTGKAGEIIVVIEKKHWNSAVGGLLKDYLAKQQIALPQPEPVFNLVNISHASFTGILKIHRNILLIDFTDKESPSFIVKRNIWASGQLVVKITAPDADFVVAMISKNKEALSNHFINIERERLIKKYAKIEDKVITKKLLKNHQISLTVPKGFEITKEGEDFVWIRSETGQTSQGILIYYHDYVDTNAFTKEYIISARDSITRQYIPGPHKDSYMTTMTEYPTAIREIRFNNYYAVEARGLWNVHGDFMGGPYLSYTILDEKGNRVVTIDGYIYAPKFKKRNYLRQVEAILCSLKFPV